MGLTQRDERLAAAMINVMSMSGCGDKQVKYKQWKLLKQRY